MRWMWRPQSTWTRLRDAPNICSWVNGEVSCETQLWSGSWVPRTLVGGGWRGLRVPSLYDRVLASVASEGL